jgi:hypothetical protein
MDERYLGAEPEGACLAVGAANLRESAVLALRAPTLEKIFGRSSRISRIDCLNSSRILRTLL